MDLNAVHITRELVVRLTKIFKIAVQNSLRPINSKEVKETGRILLNILELTLNVQNETEVDGTDKYITIDTFFYLTHISGNLEQVLRNIQIVLSVLQKPGSPPTEITSDNNSFIFKVLQEDPKYNFSLSKMLHIYPDIPVTFSSVLMKRLQTSLKREDKLSLCVAVINNNLFKWFDRVTVSNLLLISLNKHTAEKNMINIRSITSPVDMKMHVNNSFTKVNEQVSQTIPLDPSSDEDSLDLQIRVHRLDPVQGSKLSVTFLYPPTNVTLRVLIVEDYRPTYKMMMSQSSLITQQSPYYSPNYTRSESKTIYYMGVIPGPGFPLSQTVLFSFIVNSTTCVSWERVEWSTSGCRVGPNTGDNKVHCQCNHLSIFGAIFPFQPNQIDPFADAKLFLTLWDNPLVVSLMVVLVVFYIILSIASYHMDKKDRFRGAITILEDNFPYDRHPYVLAVYTSSHFFSGTSANVGVQIIGELASSRAHILQSKYYKVLNRQSDDWFLILCPKPLGHIQYLHIWHDNTGFSPDWYCDKIHIYDIDNSLEYLLIVEQWLETNIKNYPEALIIPASTEDILRIDRVFSNNISRCIREQQSSVGIITQHPRSTIRRIQRVNIFMCSVLITMLCSIMFYTDPKKAKPDDYKYNVKIRDLYISYVTIAVIFSVSYVIDLLFQKSYKCVSSRNPSLLYLRRSMFLEEYVDPDKQLKHSDNFTPYPEEQNHTDKPKSVKKRFAIAMDRIVKSQNLIPAVMLHGDPGIQVNRIWLLLAFTVCAITIIICLYLIMLYGLKMGLVNSKKWLTVLFISFIHDQFAINPVSVITIAIILTASFSLAASSSNYRVTEDEIKRSVVGIQNESLERLIKRRQHPMYSPIKVGTRRKMIEKKQICLYRIQLLRFFLSLCYIISVVGLIHKVRYLNFVRTSHLETIIDSAVWDDNSVNFYDAYDKAELSNYFFYTFLRVIYFTRWYNTRPLYKNGSSPYWTSDYSWRMIGVPYLRQQRVYEEPCNSISPPPNWCIPHFSSKTEDIDNYGIGWSSYYDFDIRKDSYTSEPWTYTHPRANWLKTYYRLQGISDTIYDNGGYEAKLGSSIQETVKAMAELVDNTWVDKYTKAVFVELTLYNVNLRCLGQITLVIEFLTEGVSLNAIRISSVVMDCGGLKFIHIAFIMLTLLYFLEIFYQINYSGFTTFFKDIRNILLVVITIPSTLVIVAFLIYVYKCIAYDLWERFYKEKYEYFDFDNLISFSNSVTFILSFLLLFGVLRTLLLLKRFKVFTIIYSLFKLSLNIRFPILLLTSLFFIFIFQILLHFDISTSHRITNLVISQKKTKLFGSEYFCFEFVCFSCMKFCTMMMISGVFVTIFIHFSPMSRTAQRKL